MPQTPPPSAAPTATRYASLITDELASYFMHLGTRSERLFCFPGQDPFAFAAPAEAISALYWSRKEGPRRQAVADGLVEALGSRTDALPVQALEEIIFAVGLIGDPEILMPMVRRVSARAVGEAAPRGLFVRALMVLKSFGISDLTSDAARSLAGSKAFPADLAYDAFEFMALHSKIAWTDQLSEVLPKLNEDQASTLNLPRVRARLRETASWLSERLPVDRIAHGLDELMSIDAEDRLTAIPLFRRQDPIGQLMCALVEDACAPFTVEPSILKGRVQLRRKADNASAIFRDKSPTAQWHDRIRNSIPNDIPVLKYLEEEDEENFGLAASDSLDEDEAIA